MNNDPPKSIDLQQLAIDREQGKTLSRPILVRWLTRYLVPAVLILGFVALFGWAMRSSLLPASQVSVAPVMVMKGSFRAADTPVFQAAGWVEPMPAPIVATALARGVVQEMHVVEGAYVKAGDPLASLIETDAKIALGDADAKQQLQTAEVLRAKAILKSAEEILENPLDLQVALADASALVAEVELAVSNLPYEIQSARSQYELAKANLEGKRLAGDAISGRSLREAESQLSVATKKHEELRARQPRLQAQLESYQAKQQAAERKLKMKTDERRAVEVARANLAASEALLLQTEFARDAAQLELERMVVVAPISGYILSINAHPGERLSGLNPHSEHGSAAVATLYDPKHLQVRVDVRLEDIGEVSLGQRALVQTAAVKEAIMGKVISITTKADIQKNTLQVKVALVDPPSLVKPEMLVKVTFLSQEVEAGEAAERTSLQILVPQQLVLKQGERATVWVANRARDLAEQREITLGAYAAQGDLVEVTSGLTVTDRLIVHGREQLAEGSRIRIVAEESSVAHPAEIVVH